MQTRGPRGLNLVELTVGLVLAAVVVVGVSRAFTAFNNANARQRHHAEAAQMLELIANDIRSNFAKRRAEVSPVPNPQVNLIALAAPELGTAAAPAPPCVTQAAGPVCVRLRITRNIVGGGTANVSYQTTCDGGNIPAAATVAQVHPALLSTYCTSAPRITIDSDGKITKYPGTIASDVLATAVCFRCYDKGNNTYEWVAELSAAFPGPKKTWTVLRKDVGLSTDLVSPGIEIIGP